MTNGAETATATAKEPTVKSRANEMHEMVANLAGQLDGLFTVLSDMGLGQYDPKPDTDSPTPSDPTLLGTLNGVTANMGLQLERFRVAFSQLKAQVE